MHEDPKPWLLPRQTPRSKTTQHKLDLNLNLDPQHKESASTKRQPRQPKTEGDKLPRAEPRPDALRPPSSHLEPETRPPQNVTLQIAGSTNANLQSDDLQNAKSANAQCDNAQVEPAESLFLNLLDSVVEAPRNSSLQRIKAEAHRLLSKIPMTYQQAIIELTNPDPQTQRHCIFDPSIVNPVPTHSGPLAQPPRWLSQAVRQMCNIPPSHTEPRHGTIRNIEPQVTLNQQLSYSLYLYFLRDQLELINTLTTIAGLLSLGFTSPELTATLPDDLQTVPNDLSHTLSSHLRTLTTDEFHLLTSYLRPQPTVTSVPPTQLPLKPST